MAAFCKRSKMEDARENVGVKRNAPSWAHCIDEEIGGRFFASSPPPKGISDWWAFDKSCQIRMCDRYTPIQIRQVFVKGPPIGDSFWWGRRCKKSPPDLFVNEMRSRRRVFVHSNILPRIFHFAAARISARRPDRCGSVGRTRVSKDQIGVCSGAAFTSASTPPRRLGSAKR